MRALLPYVNLSLIFGLVYFLTRYLLESAKRRARPGAGPANRSRLSRPPTGDPFPEEFLHELRVHGIPPQTVREVQRVDEMALPKIEMLHAMIREGQTRGVGIVNRVCHGKQRPDQVVYLVSVADPTEVENVVIAFLGNSVDFVHCPGEAHDSGK